jgi:hypothetical protein
MPASRFYGPFMSDYSLNHAAKLHPATGQMYVFFSLARFISFSPPPLHKYFYLPVFAHPRITIIIKKSRWGCSFPLAPTHPCSLTFANAQNITSNMRARERERAGITLN